MLVNGNWWYDHAREIKDFIEEAKLRGDDRLVAFLTKEKDKNCRECEHWNLAGHYDSGNMGVCEHPKIAGGRHHPSNGCGTEEITMVYIPSCEMNQEMWTRWNYSCALWKRKNGR